MADSAIEKLIYDELKGVDELLSIHAYHKQVLTDLLKKMNGQTGRIGRNINTLPITQRSVNCLMAEGIYTVEELTKKTQIDLLKSPNLGEKSLRDIKDALASEGLSLSRWPEESKNAVLEKIGIVEVPQEALFEDVSDDAQDQAQPVTKKVDLDTKKVDPDVDWLVPLPISSKPEANRINRARRLELAVIVARMVKSQGCKKIDAIKELYGKGDINYHEFVNLPRQISRSHLGSDHDLLFEGTKYANKK